MLETHLKQEMHREYETVIDKHISHCRGVNHMTKPSAFFIGLASNNSSPHWMGVNGVAPSKSRAAVATAVRKPHGSPGATPLLPAIVVALSPAPVPHACLFNRSIRVGRLGRKKSGSSRVGTVTHGLKAIPQCEKSRGQRISHGLTHAYGKTALTPESGCTPREEQSAGNTRRASGASRVRCSSSETIASKMLSSPPPLLPVLPLPPVPPPSPRPANLSPLSPRSLAGPPVVRPGPPI